MNALLRIAGIMLLAAAPLHAEVWEEGSRLPAPLEKAIGGDAMAVTIHRLSNGLSVYLSPNNQEPRIAAWIAVRAGSAHDPADSTGMAHYLEHMLFKGSERLGTMDYAAEKPHLEKIQALYEQLFKTKDAAGRAKVYRRIDEENQQAGKYAAPNEIDRAYKGMGVRGVNAFTSKERTVYICNLPKNRVPAWSKLEGDRFKRPVFRLFQSEIETVYEELNKRSLDNPHFALGERLDKALYGDTNPYGRSVIGTVAHLKNPSLAKMYAFYGRWYVPNNMAVALSGDFDRKEMLALLESEFGSWEPKPLPERAPLQFPQIKGVKRAEFKFEAEEQVVVAWRTVGKNHPDSDALAVLDMVMDNSEAGIVNLTLNQAQKVKRAGSYPSQFVESGAWQLWAVPKEGQTLEQAERLLLGAVAELKNGEFTDEDLKAIVRNFEIGEKEKLESNEARVAQMADAFLSYDAWERRVGRIRRLRNVSKEEVLRVAKKYLGPDRVVIYRRKGKPELPKIKKPEFTKFALDSSRQSAFLKEIISIPAEPIEPKWVKEGRDYRVKSVPSGRLYVVKNPINDLFSANFQFERGRRHERYLCEALDLLNLAGADQTSAEELKKKFYSLGVKMSTYCGEERSGVILSGLEESLAEGLSLMRRRFAAPKLEKDTLKKMAEVKIGAHKDNKLNPGYVFSALSEYAQRGRKSSVLSELADGELALLSESELRRLMMNFFDYERRTSYVGTLKASKAAQLLGGEEKHYRESPKREARAYVKRTTTTIVFADRKMAQAQVGVFWPEEIFDPERYVDYKFFSNYMGGGMSAVIFQEIREARSLAYQAWGGYAPGSHAGDENRVIGRLGTQADKTIEATGLLVRLLREMPVSEERFIEAGKSIEQGYRTNPIKFRSVAGAVMRWEDRGLKRDPRPARMKKALSYSLKDLTGFAKDFRDRNATIYILGNKENIDLEGLKSLGMLIEKKINDLFPY